MSLVHPSLKPIRTTVTRESYSNRLNNEVRLAKEDIIRRRAAGDKFPEFQELLRNALFPSRSTPVIRLHFHYWFMYCVTPRAKRQYTLTRNQKIERELDIQDALSREFAQYRKDKYYWSLAHQAKVEAEVTRRVRPRIE